jgi:hypothetical protein
MRISKLKVAMSSQISRYPTQLVGRNWQPFISTSEDILFSLRKQNIKYFVHGITSRSLLDTLTVVRTDCSLLSYNRHSFNDCLIQRGSVFSFLRIRCPFSSAILAMCRGLNFRDSSGPARRTFKPSFKFIFLFPVPYQSPASFYSSPNEARSVYSLPWLSSR